jgi:hypothetical protein
MVSSACLRSYLVPVSIVSLGVSDTYIAPRSRTPDHHGDPQPSGLKFQTAFLTVVCVISQVRIAVFCKVSIECFSGRASKF